MSEEKREAKNEWITQSNRAKKFWATASDLGLDETEVHNALHFVKSCYDFTGTLEEALALIAAYAELKATAIEAVTKAAQANAVFTMVTQLPEAPMVAWTHFQKGPGKPTWSFTVRPELPPDLADALMKETFRQIKNFEKWLDKNDFRPVYRSNEMAASPIPAPTQQPAKTQGTMPPPPTGAGNGPPQPPPPSGSTPPPAGQQGNGNGGETTYTADSITALVSPNGNRYYAVRGGPVKRHGATAWPEVAEQLKTITDYDPANLEIGKPWDVSAFGIRVLATIPAGKQYPNKVVNFLPATSA